MLFYIYNKCFYFLYNFRQTLDHLISGKVKIEFSLDAGSIMEVVGSYTF
jgi:hypothetical protein